MKDTLVVTAKSSGAEAIPFIKVWMMFPGAILLTFIFTRLSNRLSQESVFYSILGIFLGYFFIFAFFLYPISDSLHLNQVADRLQVALPAGFKGFIAMIRYWLFSSFYVMSELWSNIILSLLFWGFANQITRLGEAKRFYGLFGIGINLSGVAAGTASYYLCLDKFDLQLLIIIVLAAGALAMLVFRWMNKTILTDPLFYDREESQQEANIKGKMSLRDNFSYLLRSRYLICIALIVVGYNLVINLVEVVWKHEVRELYPNPKEFSLYMNQVMAIIGVVSTFTSLFISGNIIRKFGWTFTALLTPVILFATSVGFFTFFFMKDHMGEAMIAYLGTTPLAIAVFFGTAQNIMSRAAKYTVYDATKEMAFVPLSSECKLKGKAAIDGVCNRLGKSGGSVIHQTLLVTFSSITASAPYVAGFLLVIIFIWGYATMRLGRKFNTLTQDKPESIKVKETMPTLVPAEAAS